MADVALKRGDTASLERTRQRAREAFAAQLEAAWQRGRDGGEPDIDSALSAAGTAVNAWVTAAIAADLSAMARDKAKVAADWDRAVAGEASHD